MNTVREIQNYFPNVSSEKAKIIDQNIKKSIADDDSYDSIKIYVQRELRGKKVKKRDHSRGRKEITTICQFL